MRLTNKWALPAPLARALASDNYSKGMADISVTGLLQPPKIAILREQHGDELEEDISNRLWSMFGTAIHNIIEQGAAGLEGYIPEQRLYAVVNGTMISGGIDLQEETDGGIVLVDWKTTSTWAVMNGKKDWEYQLNLYAYLMWKNKNTRVVGLQIGALIKDWNKRLAMYTPGYPEKPVMMIDIPLWTIDEQESFVEALVEKHKNARDVYEISGSLPDCTPEEMWESGGGWAVMKPGRKSAVKLFSSEEQAKIFINGDPDLYIETRPVSRMRCDSYCAASSVCEQHQQWLRNNPPK